MTCSSFSHFCSLHQLLRVSSDCGDVAVSVDPGVEDQSSPALIDLDSSDQVRIVQLIYKLQADSLSKFGLCYISCALRQSETQLFYPKL